MVYNLLYNGLAMTGQGTKNRKIAARMVSRVHRTGKPGLIQIMRDLESGLSKAEAARSYDRVTRAINGWLRAHTRDLPKGLHAKLLLANCFSLNLCWMKGRTGLYAPKPALWVQLGDKRGGPGPRAYMRRMRLKAWAEWVQAGRP